MLLLEASVTHKGLVKVANGDWLEWEQLFWGALFSPEYQWSQRNLLRQWSCAPFYTTWLYLCWVMVCQVTTSRPTQTQGHTHHDTVESVWLGSRSTSKWEEGEKVTDVFVHPSFITSPPPCLPICHYPHSISQVLLTLYSSFRFYAQQACFLWNYTKSVSILNLLGVPCMH